MSLRRAHKDRRARKHLLAVVLLALIPFFCLAYLAWLAGSGALLFVPFVLPVLWWRSRRARQDDVNLSITPNVRPAIRELSVGEVAAVRQYFADLALSFAVLFHRAGSESFLKQKTLPEGVEVISRRVNLDLLREHNIWDRLDAQDRLMLMMADGHWDWRQINHAAQAMEPLRLLRWILRIDFFLPEIGKQLHGDYSLARELVNEPGKLFNGTAMIDWATMAAARDASQHYYFRCVAEAISRGKISAANDQAVAWAKGIAEPLKGNQNEDFVLGTQLVSESSDELLGWTIQLSKQRADFLVWAMQIRETGSVPEMLLGLFPNQTEPDTMVETAVI